MSGREEFEITRGVYGRFSAIRTWITQATPSPFGAGIQRPCAQYG